MSPWRGSISFELAYGRAYDPVADCEWEDPTGPITWGRFYHEEDMPDKEVARRALHLAQTRRPDLLWVHLNALDYIGHRYGGTSRPYTAHLHQVDAVIAEVASRLYPEYTIYVTGDHGMGDEGPHRGRGDAVRLTPLYVVGGASVASDAKDKRETEAAPLPQWRLGQLLQSVVVNKPRASRAFDVIVAHIWTEQRGRRSWWQTAGTPVRPQRSQRRLVDARRVDARPAAAVLGPVCSAGRCPSSARLREPGRRSPRGGQTHIGPARLRRACTRHYQA